ncbi:MAG: hypothetical protein ACE5KO_02150 [Candidatus Bathyarchaeia archaeon]
MSRTWRSLPLSTHILEILRRVGPLTDEDLLRNLKKDAGDIGISTLNKALLQLEIWGFVRVSNAPRGRKKVEMISSRKVS